MGTLSGARCMPFDVIRKHGTPVSPEAPASLKKSLFKSGKLNGLEFWIRPKIWQYTRVVSKPHRRNAFSGKFFRHKYCVPRYFLVFHLHIKRTIVVRELTPVEHAILQVRSEMVCF